MLTPPYRNAPSAAAPRPQQRARPRRQARRGRASRRAKRRHRRLPLGTRRLAPGQVPHDALPARVRAVACADRQIHHELTPLLHMKSIRTTKQQKAARGTRWGAPCLRRTGCRPGGRSGSTRWTKVRQLDFNRIAGKRSSSCPPPSHVHHPRVLCSLGAHRVPPPDLRGRRRPPREAAGALTSCHKFTTCLFFLSIIEAC